MAEANVVALDGSFERDLPVEVGLIVVRIDQVQVGRDQVGQPLAGILLARLPALGDEDDSGALLGQDRDEAVSALVEVRKAAFVLDALESTVEPVGPAVIRTDERLRAAHPARHLGSAVATRIAEGAHLSVLPAHGEDGDPGRLARDVGTGLPECGGGTERHWQSAQNGKLPTKALLAAIVLHRLAPHLVALVGRAVAHVREDSRSHRLVVHESLHDPTSLQTALSKPGLHITPSPRARVYGADFLIFGDLHFLDPGSIPAASTNPSTKLATCVAAHALEPVDEAPSEAN